MGKLYNILLMGEESLCIKEEKSLHADDNQEDLRSHPNMKRFLIGC